VQVHRARGLHAVLFIQNHFRWYAANRGRDRRNRDRGQIRNGAVAGEHEAGRFLPSDNCKECPRTRQNRERWGILGYEGSRKGGPAAKEKALRNIVALLATLVFAACSTPPVSRSQSQAASPGQAVASEGQKPSTDSVVEFLLTASATDFHTHRPPDVARFRDVRFGHIMTAAGAKQYLLCGEFLPAQREGKAEWMPFATIKTSGYEQWNGAQAASWCKPSQVVWDSDGDLSSSLQNRLDSLR